MKPLHDKKECKGNCSYPPHKNAPSRKDDSQQRDFERDIYAKTYEQDHSRPQSPCGCIVSGHPETSYTISYCPLHRSAASMLELLRDIKTEMNTNGVGIGYEILYTQIKDLLAKMEGK